MKKIGKHVLAFFKLIHLHTILLILAMYLLLCFFCFLVLKNEGMETPFWDIVVFNLLAVTGNDYM